MDEPLALGKDNTIFLVDSKTGVAVIICNLYRSMPLYK
jgi:hypothetical protein